MGEGDHGNDVHWRPRGADPLRRWRTVSPTINLCLPGESNNLATMRTVLSDAGRGRDEDADLVQGDKAYLFAGRTECEVRRSCLEAVRDFGHDDVHKVGVFSRFVE